MITGVSASEARRGSLRGRLVTAAGSTPALLRSSAPVAQVVRFVWHYVQMAIAKELGCFCPQGSSCPRSRSLRPSVTVTRASALVMTVEMALGMVAWMCMRRHPWRHTVEMLAGMSASTLVAAAASLAVCFHTRRWTRGRWAS